MRSIQAACPAVWKRCLTVKGSENLTSYQKIEKNRRGATKLIYWELTNSKKRLDDKYRGKWEEILQCEINDKAWEGCYNNISKLTLSTKLRSFQYRLVNLALITNIDLYKWKIKNTDSCTFCQLERETYLHLFVKCKEVRKKMWVPLRRWLDYYCYLELPDLADEIMLNNYKGPYGLLVNTIVLITKQYIYAKRCLQQALVSRGCVNNFTDESTGKMYRKDER